MFVMDDLTFKPILFLSAVRLCHVATKFLRSIELKLVHAYAKVQHLFYKLYASLRPLAVCSSTLTPSSTSVEANMSAGVLNSLIRK